MSEWEKVSLGDLIQLQRGYDLPTSRRRSGRIPVVGSAGVSGYHNESLFEGPGVAIGRSGSSIGVATYVREAYWPLNTTLFVTDFRGNDPRWVYRMFQLLDLRSFDSGSAQPSLNRNYLASRSVAVPPIETQRAIADVLGALDDKIEANRKLAATADDLGTALVREALDPGQVDRLGDVAAITMGSSPPGKTMNEDGDGLPFFQGVRDFGLRFPTRRVWTTSPTRSAAEGDILLSVRAPVGQVNYAPERLCIGRGLAAVRSLTGNQETLFHLLRSVRRAWAEYDSGGTVFGSINRDQLHNIEVPAIRHGAVERCQAEVSRLESRMASALREITQLSGLRDALLPKLMSGQLRVCDAEALVGRGA